MHHISDTGFPYKQGRAGGRTGSSRLRESYEKSREFAGLEEDTNRYDLLLLVKRAGKAAGFSPRMIALLDYYMAFTRDVDWEQGARPIVYQSLSRTSLDLGISERQVQKLEKMLFDSGALTWNDSGNHRRYGQRDPQSGMILYAFGVDLTPLAYLRAALTEKLQEKQLYDAAWMEMKRQISWHRRQIRAILSELAGRAQGRAGELALIEGRYEAIAMPIRTYMDLNALSKLLGEHKTLYESILTMAEESFPAPEMQGRNDNDARMIQNDSSMDEQNIVNYKSTTQKQSDKSDHSRPTGQSLQKGVVEPPEPQASPGQTEKILSTGLQHITLKQAMNAASERFREHIPLEPRPMSWNDIIEAAYKLKSALHISQQSWAEACVTLGRTGAAICVLLTDQAAQRERDPVTKPAAYFNGMIARARKGELHLHNSIFGILKREKGLEE